MTIAAARMIAGMRGTAWMRTSRPSTTAIHAAMRSRRARSHRPVGVEPCSTSCPDGTSCVRKTMAQTYHAGNATHVPPTGASSRRAALAELRAAREEERNVGAEPDGQQLQPREVKRLGERLVREPERGRRVGASAAEAGRDRNPLRQARGPERLDAGLRPEELEG